MDKVIAYRELVKKRKNFEFEVGLTNPSTTEFDVDELDPWAQWQNSLDAKILVIGQEYCDVKTYNRTEGKVEVAAGQYEFPSNKNLKEYFEFLKYDLGHPTSPNRNNPIFFTNAVIGLKDGSMSANFNTKWLRASREEFVEPLIEIIQPKFIITIGQMATKTVAAIYGIKMEAHKKMVDSSPIQKEEVTIFPVFHTGGLGLRNRSRDAQVSDWKKIAEYICAAEQITK